MGKITTNRFWPAVLGILCFITLLGLCLQCKDPFDWQPGDPQTPPPDPPELYLPAEDTMFFTSGPSYNVRFDWEEIPAYQIQYEIQVDTSTSFNTAAAVIYTATSSPAAFSVARYSYRMGYYCRVRAGSPAWTWYTGWSEQHHFWIIRDMY